MAHGDAASVATDRRAERRFQFLMTVLVMVSGVGGTVLGVHLGNENSRAVTEEQIAAQRQDSRAQFLRDERRAAYGKVVAIDGLLHTKERELRDVDARRPLAVLREVKVETKESEALLDRLEMANSTVVLIGSVALANAGERLWYAHRSYITALAGFAPLDRAHQELAQGRGGQRLPEELERLRRVTNKFYRDLVEAEGEYQARARFELAEGLDLDSLDLDEPKE